MGERPTISPAAMAALDKALAAAKKVNKLEEDAHPGLFTWQTAWHESAMEFKAAVDEYAALPKV